jgi:2,4-dienoyl-CoA reductase-like NADH-dependent reductase (Old Yellow Enzyme family)
MSILFSPSKIGNVELPNRFVCSATHELMAKETGELSLSRDFNFSNSLGY